MIRTAASVGIVAVSAALVCLLLSVALAVERVPEILAAEVAASRMMLQGEIQATRAATVREIRTVAQLLDRQTTVTRKELLAEAQTARKEALQRVDALVAVIDARTAGLEAVAPAAVAVLNRYEVMPDDIASALQPYTDCEANGLCWQNMVSDNLFAARAASRAVGQSVPSAMKSIERASASAADASAASAGVARNLEKATKPLPWWARFIPVAGAASQVAVPFVLGNLK